MTEDKQPNPRACAAALGAAVRWHRPAAEIADLRARLDLANAAAAVARAQRAVEGVQKP